SMLRGVAFCAQHHRSFCRTADPVGYLVRLVCSMAILFLCTILLHGACSGCLAGGGGRGAFLPGAAQRITVDLAVPFPDPDLLPQELAKARSGSTGGCLYI